MIRKTCLALLASLVMTGPALAALDVGAKAPGFTTPAALAGKEFSFALAEALKKGPVVVYFFPKVFTKGCTVEANAFAEANDDFEKMGATVIGLSNDGIEDIKAFSVQECRNKFAVGVASPTIIKGYDVALSADSDRSNRTSYVIAPGGDVLFVHSEMAPLGHISGSMAAVKAWHEKSGAKSGR